MKRVVLLILAACLLTGCAGIQLPSACDTVQGPSVLCRIAADQGVNLSVVADGLGLTNIVAIEKGLYSRQEALKVLAGLRAFMESPVTYVAFRAELSGVIEAYPYLLQTADRYLARLVSARVMYPDDQRMIMGWLDRLIAGLDPEN